MFQICDVCSQNYSVFYNLDDGLRPIYQVLNITEKGSRAKVKDETRLKVVGPKIQRKFFSEITADEMEKLYNQYKQDFLLFGYSLDFYRDNKT